MTNFLSPENAPVPPELPRRHLAQKTVLALLIIIAIGAGIFLLTRHRFVVTATMAAKTFQEKLVTIKLWHSQPAPATVAVPLPPKPQRKTDTADLDVARFSAKHIFIKDSATGIMLAGKAAYDPWPLASVTKLLSALVLLDVPVNLATTTITATDTVFEIDVAPGVAYATKDLWHAALINSSNLSVVSLVDSTGLSRADFVARLNAKAKELGMTNTVVFEPTGLDPRNVTTAADAALLVAEAMRKPLIRDTVLMKTYALNSRDGKHFKKIYSTNWLVLGIIPSRSLLFRGGKTGSIPQSDYNFVFEAENVHGRVIDVVVLGSGTNESRFAEGRDAALWAFGAYSWGDDGATSTIK